MKIIKPVVYTVDQVLIKHKSQLNLGDTTANLVTVDFYRFYRSKKGKLIFSFQLALIRQSVRQQSTVVNSEQPEVGDKPPDYEAAMADPPDYAPVFAITK